MNRELAHRRRDVDTATHVTVKGPGSRQAVEVVRAQIPADEIVLYVRQAE